MQNGVNRLHIFNQIISKITVNDCYFLFVFHLSKNNHPYLKKWIKTFNTVGVISIPYSEKEEVRSDIEKLTTLFRPKLDKISELIIKICQQHKEKKIILVEIGGYSAKISDKLKNVKLAVEDTNQGYWNFVSHKDKLNFPVVSMSNTEIKKLENIHIAQSIVYSTETLLRKYFNQDFLHGKKVFVISYGGIGSVVCKCLQGHHAHVSVYDKDPIKMAMAHTDGYQIATKEKLKYADVIIGCTGSRSLEMEDIHLLKEYSLLISGSSKQVEFPYDCLCDFVDHKSKGKEIELINYQGKKFYIAYHGQPINFLHDSALGDVFDMQMSLLLQCVKYGLVNKLENKVYELPLEHQYPIAEIYIKDKLESI